MNGNILPSVQLCAIVVTWSLFATVGAGRAADDGSPATVSRAGIVSKAVHGADKVQASMEPSDELTPYKYVGNNFSLKFHRPSCPFAKAMWTGHTELFHFRKDAIAAKYAPCRYCLPPSWTNVNATILAPKTQKSQPAVVSGQASSHLNQTEGQKSP